MTSLRMVTRIALTSAMVVVVCCLPVVPVLTAPVVPDPIYRFTLVSLLQILAVGFLTGIRLQATWMTLPAIIALAVAAFFAIRFLNRRIFGPPRAKP